MQINLTQKAVKYFDEIIYVPVWARYLAVDADGTLAAYEHEPQLCESVGFGGYWVLCKPGNEIDICHDVDLEGIDFKDTCVNIESEVDDKLLHTMRTYLAGNILPVSDNPHDHTEWFERMRKGGYERELLGEWKPQCGQQNKEGDKDE